MNMSGEFATLKGFSGANLTQTIACIEQRLVGSTRESCEAILQEHNAQPVVLEAAGVMKRMAGQVNVLIHSLGILLCLPQLLKRGEIVESVSLGAGNTGKRFDLETNQRVAEFKFITWQGGAESIRQNSLFKDFYGLAEYSSFKSRHLYVLGTKIPEKFLHGKRAIGSVLSKNAALLDEFTRKYPEYLTVSDYYLPRRGLVEIRDISPILPDLTFDETV